MTNDDPTALLDDLRDALIARLPDDWSNAAISWFDLGGRRAPAVARLSGFRSARDEPLTSGEQALLDRVVEALTTGRGAPISIELFIDRREPGVGLDVNRDRRVVVDAQGRDVDPDGAARDAVFPTPDEWRAELERHPRPADAIPAWWSRLIGAAPTADAGVAATVDAALEGETRLTARLEPLRPLPGTGTFLRQLDAWVVDRIRSLDAEALASLAGRSGHDAQARERDAIATEAAERTVNPPRMAKVGVIAELLDAWHARTGEGAPIPSIPDAVAGKPLLVASKTDAAAGRCAELLPALLRAFAADLIDARFGAAD